MTKARTSNTGAAPGDPAALLRTGERELGLQLAPEQREKLLQLTDLLHAWSARINLTGYKTASQIVQRLILDALSLSRILPRSRRLVDLGSGAGFPGLPLAILWSEVEVLLVEPREKRNHFQRAAIRNLGLQNVRTSRARIEAPDPDRGDGVLAQAVGISSALVDGMSRWCEPRGFLAIPGGEEPPVIPPHPAFPSTELHRYQVPSGGPARTLWIGRVA